MRKIFAYPVDELIAPLLEFIRRHVGRLRVVHNKFPDLIHRNIAQRSFPKNRHSAADRAPNSRIRRAKQRNRRAAPVCRKVGDSGIVANESAARSYLFGDRLQRQAFQTRAVRLKLPFRRVQSRRRNRESDSRVRQTRASTSMDFRCQGE